MQTLLKILLRYSNFLVFIALEVAAFMLISRNNVYPRSSILSTANSFVAWQNEQIHEINSYFHLRSMNEQLAAENAALRNQICSMDSAQTGESFHYVPAKAVEMTTDRLHNYVTINKGSKDGIQRGQGVRNEDHQYLYEPQLPLHQKRLYRYPAVERQRLPFCAVDRCGGTHGSQPRRYDHHQRFKSRFSGRNSRWNRRK